MSSSNRTGGARVLKAGMHAVAGLAVALPLVLATPRVASAAPDDSSIVDALVREEMARYGIPGAAVAVVSDGRLEFAQGYGVADVATAESVNAEETLFPIDSVSKVLTATAVMRLVDEGRLGLDVDVNTYLEGFSVPDTYPDEPITLRHLLTHTAGFEEKVVGILPAHVSDVEPLGEFLAGH